MTVQSRILRSIARGETLLESGPATAALGDHVAAFRANFASQIRQDRSPADGDRAGGEPTIFRIVPDRGTIEVPTTLSVAQVAIIQYSTDDADDPHIPGVQPMQRDAISFVLLAPVGSGTVIFFTDRAWNGTSFAGAGGGEGTYTWTAATDLAAGTVITIDQAELTAAGMALADTGETIYAYQGPNANTPTTFLYAIDVADGNNVFEAAKLTNTGLTAGIHTAAIGADNASFGERLWNQPPSLLLQNIGDPLSWHTNENSPQTSHIEGTNLFVAPDVQIWIAGISGGHGLMSVSGDATQNGGLGYNVQTHFQNTSNDGNGLTTTSRFWSPTHILFDTVENKFFVVDSSGTFDRILQGNISDMLNNPGNAPPMTILYSEQPAVSDGIGITGHIVDIANNHIYFTRSNLLMRVNYDTPNQTPTTLIDLGNDTDTLNPNFANEIALDLANGRAFIVSTESFSDFVSVAPGTPGSFESPPGSGNFFIVGTVMYQNSIHMVSNIASSDTGIGNNVAVQLNFNEAFDEDNGAFGAQDNEFDDAFGRIMSIDINQLTGEIWFTTVQLNGGSDGSVGGIFRATLSGNTLNVVQIYSETNATNFNFLHIHVDEETGFYYVTSQEPGEQGRHSVFRGALNAAPGTAPTFFAEVGNINEMTPRDLTVESAPTITANALAAAVTEASNMPGSGLTGGALLFSAIAVSDIDTPNGTDEIAGAQVRITGNFQTGATHQDSLRINGNESGTIAASGIAYSYNATTGVLTLSGPGTTAEYQSALALVTFHTSGDNITNYGQATTRTVAASVFDGLLYSDEITNTVSVTGINDAPVNTVGGAGAATEDGSAIALTGISIFDVDADPATQNLSVTLSVAHGTITILTNVSGGIVAGQITAGANGSVTMTITATQNQINATLAAAGGLTYTPAANYNGADALTVVTNDLGSNGNDPGLTGTGTSEQDSDNKAINIAAVNDAPTVTDSTQAAATIFEDQPSAVGETVLSLFNASFSDALDQQQVPVTNPTGSVASTLAGIAIVADGSTPATGQWEYWNGSAWTDIGAASQAAARTFTAATQIRFSPALNYNGAAPTLTVHLIETGGPAITNNGTVNLSPAGTATGGTTVYSSGTVVLSQDITPVNDAPTQANVGGDTATFTEGQALAALLDVGSNAVIADVDSANFDTGTLTVAITGGLAAAQDQLVIRLTGTVSFNVAAVFVNGTQIATYTGAGPGGGPLVFTFDADATPAAVSELVRAIAYTNSGGDNPTGGTRTITWTLVDGGGQANLGQDTLSFTTTVDVLAVNDAPAGMDRTATLPEDGSYTLATADFGFSDPAEGHAFAGVVLTTLPVPGTLLLNGVPITVAGTFVSAADISGGLLTYAPAADGNGTGYASFTFQVRDDGGFLNGGQDTDQSPNTFTFDVAAVNDAPVNGVPGAQNVNEDGTLIFNAGNGNLISVSDVDVGAGELTVTLTATNGLVTLSGTTGLTFTTGTGTGDGTMTFSGTQAAINAALDGLTYAPTANYNGPATLTVTTNDGGGTGADPGLSGGAADEEDSDQIAITVNSVNDAPSGVSATVTASEDDPYVFLTADFGFSDPIDGDGFAGVVLTTLPVEGDLRLNGVNITVAGTFISAADIAAGLLTFLADPDEYGAGYASFDFQVRDDGGILNGGQDTDQSPNTITIDVTPDNIAPALDLDADDSNTAGTGYTAAFTEGGAAVLITDADVSIADPDIGATVEGATIAINGPVAGDQLVLGPQGGFVVTGSGTATITITGTGTAAQYEAMLALITFTNTSDDPGASRTINITVTDGTDTSNVAVATIVITQINDAPTLAATGGTPTFTEGDAAVDLFSAVTASTIEAGQTFTSLTLTVTNVTDGASEVLGFDGSNVALTNGNAVTTATNGLNVTVTVAAGTATVTFSGAALSAAALQALVDGLSYSNSSENPTDADRVVTIVQVVDSGPNGGGDVNNSNPNLVATVNVDPVNDTPFNSVPGTQTIDEDASVTLSAGNGNAISVSDADATTLTVTLTVLHGTLTLASTLGLSFGAGDGSADATMTFSGTAAAINAALGAGLTYNPNANFNGSDTITVFTTDNGQSGGPAETDTDTITVNITAINDAPVVVGDGTESAATIDEDTPGAGQTVNALFAGQYSDAADNQIPNGGASSPGAFSGVAVTANGSSGATGQWQYFNGVLWVDIGAVSDAAAKLFSNTTLLRFNPAPDFNGPAPTLTVHLVDNSLGFGIVDGMVVDASVTGGTTAYSAGTVVLSQDVIAVNDGPLNTVPGAQTINEDVSVTLSTGNGNAIQVADVDAATLTVTLTVMHGTLTLASTAGLSFGAGDGSADLTMTFSGTAAAINAALGAGLTYNPTANYNGPDSISVLTTDNGQTGTGGTLQDNDVIAITINSVNDAPQGADNIVTGSEDDPYVFTAADFGFSDPVEGNAFLAVIIDSFPANGTLFLDPDGPGGAAPVDLSTIGPGVFVSVADIDLGRLFFQPDPDEYGDAYASFTFRVQDDGGTLNGGIDRDPVANTITIDIEPDNLPPVVDLNGAGAGIDYVTAFVEDGAAVAIGAGVIVSDPDAGLGDLIESATIVLTDRVAGDSLTLTGALPPGFVSVVTNLAGSITIQITGSGTGAQYQALIQSILYATTSQDPTVGGTDLARTVTVTVNDGTIDSAVATTTIDITAIDDLPVAQPDAFVITESGSIVAGNLFADNGAGADTDPDGPPLAISEVNGSAGNVGTQIVLASGALLTVNANGTFDYDPNGAYLPTPALGSGASNTPGHDSFTYTLAGGNTVTVSITLTGLDTDDILLGTAGADLLAGGTGNDTYYVENGADLVLEAEGEGNDRVIASVSWALGAGSEVETIEAMAGLAPINLTGNEFANTLIGNDGDNVLSGGAGADILEGGAGNDVLYGEGGIDVARGGTGDDVYIVDSSTDIVEEAYGEGNDTVLTQVSYLLTSGAEVELLSTTFHAGTANIELTGNYGNQTIIGNWGNNVITGGVGADVLIGLAGDDTYIVHDARALVIEDAGGGNDTVFTSVSYALAAGASVETLSTTFHAGTAALNLTGNELAQIIYGNNGGNIIQGGGGADILIGLGGDDLYRVDSSDAHVYEAIAGGNDQVYTSVSFTLDADQEIEFFAATDFAGTDAINLTGNNLNNTIYGNAGSNILDGKEGNDALIGLEGADIYAFTTALGPDNVDIIFGFEHGDRIALDDAIFTQIGGLGTLDANAFAIGAAATDAAVRIIYNSLTGQLFYDADGSGAGAQIQFATLSPGLLLTASDFMVI